MSGRERLAHLGIFDDRLSVPLGGFDAVSGDKADGLSLPVPCTVASVDPGAETCTPLAVKPETNLRWSSIIDFLMSIDAEYLDDRSR